MPLYSDARVPAPAPITRLHADEIASFARPGTWLTGEERLAVVEAARAARVHAGVHEGVAGSTVEPADVLPRATLDFIARLAVAPRDLTRADYAAARASGMSDGEYVEIVGLVSRGVNVDVFARGIGAAAPVLPSPAGGEPDYEAPPAVHEGAWLPTVPAGADAERVYGSAAPQPFIYRALSLAPAEARRCIVGGDVQYLPLEKFMDFGYSHHAGLSRVQVEIVAARVSALNDCFY